jgi:excisionase family DNA binding protein
MPRLMTTEQVVELVGAWCGVDTVRKAFRDGELAGQRLGKGYAFAEHDVEAWLARRTQPATASGPKVGVSLSARSAARRSRS